MFRSESGDGWWLVTHPDHARLAGHFAEHWGNELFVSPEPRADVFEAVRTHDDGWALRDAAPDITKYGKPNAFSSELVGVEYTFEGIDLLDYLEARRQAVDRVVHHNPYAGLLVSMHTFDLLANQADRSTIRSNQLPFLDAFLENQKALQRKVRSRLAEDKGYKSADVAPERIEDNFHLLQACDALAFFTCIDYRETADLLHALPVNGSGYKPISMENIGVRHFRLQPYPFDTSPLTLEFPGRFVQPHFFASTDELRDKFYVAEVQSLSVMVE